MPGKIFKISIIRDVTSREVLRGLLLVIALGQKSKAVNRLFLTDDEKIRQTRIYSLVLRFIAAIIN